MRDPAPKSEFGFLSSKNVFKNQFPLPGGLNYILTIFTCEVHYHFGRNVKFLQHVQPRTSSRECPTKIC